MGSELLLKVLMLRSGTEPPPLAPLACCLTIKRELVEATRCSKEA